MFLNKADLVDEEMLELVQLEVMELLESYGYDAENTPFVAGSALLALQGTLMFFNALILLRKYDGYDATRYLVLEYFTLFL